MTADLPSEIDRTAFVFFQLFPSLRRIKLCLQRNEELSAVCKDINSALSGRGGGRGDMVSGKFASTRKEIEEYLKEKIKPGDLFLTIGAGDVYKIGEEIIEDKD